MSSIQITKLDSGISLVTENIPYVKSFSLGFWFGSGSRFEEVERNGISHFIEHMVFKGTKNRTARKISDDIESIGGMLNAFTGKENTCFLGRGLSNNIGKTFEVLADIVVNPTFSKKETIKEVNVVLDEYFDILDSPEDYIFDLFEERLFGMDGLGLPVIGKEETIREFVSEDLSAYYLNRYLNDDLLIAASGKIEHGQLIGLIEKYFGKREYKPKIRNLTLPDIASDSMNYPGITQQSYTIIGTLGYGYNSDKRITQLILSNILGEGSSSRLFQAVREKKGIAYQINTFINTYSDISTFGVYFSTGEKNHKVALDIISREIEKLLLKGITKKELAKAKEMIKSSLVMSLEGTTNRMTRLANSYLRFGRIVSLDEIIEKVDLVTTEDVMDIADELLNPDDMIRITILNGN